MEDKETLTANVLRGKKDREIIGTVSNIVNMLGDHEYTGHKIKGWDDKMLTHHKAYEYQMKRPSWKTTTPLFKEIMKGNYESYLKKELKKD